MRKKRSFWQTGIKRKYLISGTISAIILTGCGGGSASDTPVTTIDTNTTTTFQAAFIDAAVAGIRYDAGEGIGGETDNNGIFRYQPGIAVKFYVNDLFIGEAVPKLKPSGVKALTEKIITPFDLTGSGGVIDQKTLQITKLLMGLDKDANVDNGIELNTSRLTPHIDSIESALESIHESVPSDEEAKAHLCQSLKVCEDSHDENSTSPEEGGTLPSGNTGSTETTEGAAIPEENSGDDSPEDETNNTAPVLSILQQYSLTEDSGLTTATAVVDYAVTDQENDTVTVTLSDTEHYRLNATEKTVTLTEMGINFLNTGHALPAFTLIPNDGDLDGTPVSVLPTVIFQNDTPDFIHETTGEDDDTYHFTIAEGATSGSRIGTVEASDEEGDRITYTLIENPSALFALDQNSGAITLVKSVDDAELGVYTLHITATDEHNATDTGNVVISIENVNDIPVFTSPVPKSMMHLYDIYEYQATASDVEASPLTFSITNKPEWAEFDTATGLLHGIATEEGIFTDITISVSDGNTTVSMEPFSIEVLPAKDLAYLYGKASQGTGVDYHYYGAPEKVIDHNDTTYNETRDDPTENWWQVALPPHTEVSKVVVLTRDVWYRDLGGAKLYLSETPYSSADMLKEEDLVATFDEGPGPFVFDFDPKKTGTYVIIKQLDDNTYDDILNIVSVEVYGTTPAEPVFIENITSYTISGASHTGDIVTSAAAIDYQDDPLSYTIVGNVPFTIDPDGTLRVNGTLDRSYYTFDIQVSDGIHTITRTVTVNITAQDVIEQVLKTGDVTAVQITEKDLVDAARAEIALLKNGNPLLQTIYADGNISYTPGNYYSQLIDIEGDPTKIFPILYGNGDHILAVAGEKEASRFAIFASNPFYFFEKEEELAYEPYMQNILTWLNKTEYTDENRTIALSFVNSSDAVENWIATHNTTWTLKYCNDSSTLESCYEGSDLVILGSNGSTDDASALDSLLPSLLQKGTSLLYLHPNWGENSLSSLIEKYFELSFPYGGNYWDNDSAHWENVLQMQAAYFEQSGLSVVDTLLEHFQNNDYAFDWSRCKKDDTTYGEQYDDCSEVVGLDTEFFDGNNKVRSIFQALENQKKNLFDLQNYAFDDFKLYKLLALLGDKLRQSVSYPMDKVATDQQQFFRSLYADASVYSYRMIDPAQPDMGNFSRSDFSHITPTTIERTMTSKVPFRSAGVYVLPGQRVTITRTDTNSNVLTWIYLNAIREGATHIFQEYGYNRPKYLTSSYFDIAPGESITLTHPYGGRVLVYFSSNDQNVSFKFENVAQHPVWAFWMSDSEKARFESDLAEEAFDWAEVITPNFELHSKLDKMRTSIANEKWENDLDTFIDAINRYTSNYPNALAGYKGNGISVIAEVENFADEHNLTIYQSDFVKHMNADQAACGTGCSGNPYDAYWAFDPVGHGDIHEIGHGLEKSLFRFDGWDYHASTNPYSYYTKSIFNLDHEGTGIYTECQNLPFETLFDALKGSQDASDVTTYMQENLWADSSWSHQVLFEIQAMMLAQYMHKFENGWHLLTNLHILERDRTRVKADWDNLKSTIGFDSYTLDEFNAISNNNWLIVSYSFAAKLDFRPFFDMYGMTYSQKASDQVASFGFEAAEKRFFVSTPNGYCTEDEYGDYLNKQILDLNETFPY